MFHAKISGKIYTLELCKNCQDTLCEGDFCCPECEAEYWEEHREEKSYWERAAKADDARHERDV